MTPGLLLLAAVIVIIAARAITTVPSGTSGGGLQRWRASIPTVIAVAVAVGLLILSESPLGIVAGGALIVLVVAAKLRPMDVGKHVALFVFSLHAGGYVIPVAVFSHTWAYGLGHLYDNTLPLRWVLAAFGPVACSGFYGVYVVALVAKQQWERVGGVGSVLATLGLSLGLAFVLGTCTIGIAMLEH